MPRIRPSRLSALALAGLLGACVAVAAQTPAPATPVDPKPPPTSSSSSTSSTSSQPAQTPPSPASSDIRPASGQASQPDRSQVTDADVERIQRNLKLPLTLKLDEQQLRYYVQILAKQQTFSQFAKGYDWKNGATMGGNPMTHAEFLSMVTPREFYSSGGITATELLQGAIVNWLGQALIKRALNDISNAHGEKELQEIRDRIDRELAMLKKGGG
jgi:hypothetical protein